MTEAIKVEFSALSQLYDQLGAISESFSSIPPHLTPDDGAFGDPKLAAGFDGFLTDWSQGRRLIGQEIQTIVQYVGYALEEYGKAESSVIAIESGLAIALDQALTTGAAVIGTVAGGASMNAAPGAVDSAGGVAVEVEQTATASGRVDQVIVSDASGSVEQFTFRPSGVAAEVNLARSDAARTEEAVLADEHGSGATGGPVMRDLAGATARISVPSTDEEVV